jgi:putative transposase
MIKQERALLWIKEGATITNNGRAYIIVALADINLVLAKEVGSNEKVLLKIGDLGPPKVIREADPAPATDRKLAGVSESDWQEAEDRRRHIGPLLNNDYQRSDALAGQIAVDAGVRWGKYSSS